MLVAVVAVVWLMLGVVSAVIMRRRGHDAFAWSLLFVFFGPLAIPMAISADRHVPPEPEPPGAAREGPFDVLVAHDGSKEAAAALESVVGMLGRGISSLTLAAVVDAEAPTTVRGQGTIDDARSRLEEIAARVGTAVDAPVDVVVLHGEPAQTLSDYAGQHGYELIVVGCSCHRTHIAGPSVARRLAHGAPVPVLLGPAVS